MTIDKNIPINKGNYSMDSDERDKQFEKNKSIGWEEEYNIYRKNWIDFPKSQFVSEYPLLVDIELASICNLKCPMCYTISDEFKKMVSATRMNFDLFKKIIDEIKGKTPAIRLSLRGEATLNKDFTKCIKYAKDNGIKEISTLTHGFKLNLTFFKQIVDAGIDWITISVDGTYETYNKIRKPLKFEDLLKKIRDINDFKKLNKLKKPVIKIQGIWPAIAENPQEFYDIFSNISDQVAFNPLIDFNEKYDDLDDKIFIENFVCPQQYQRMVIGADGLVMKCSNDENNKEVVGDIKTQTVKSIWHGKKLNEIRNNHKNNTALKKSEVCKKCYIPRKIHPEKLKLNHKEITILNYSSKLKDIDVDKL